MNCLRIVSISLLCLCFTTDAVKLNNHIQEYDDYFRKYSKRFFGVGFDWKLFKAQALAESNLTVSALSRCGAVGLMQLMPSTYADIVSKFPEFGTIDDPHWNIAAGIYYDRFLWKQFHYLLDSQQRTHFMFASYNAGQRTIIRAATEAKNSNLDHTQWESIIQIAPKIPQWRYTETVSYVERIKILYEQYLLKTKRK